MFYRTDLYFDIKCSQWPIVYRDEYNVRFCGLQRLHPFDAEKWGNIFRVRTESSSRTVRNRFSFPVPETCRVVTGGNDRTTTRGEKERPPASPLEKVHPKPPMQPERSENNGSTPDYDRTELSRTTRLPAADEVRPVSYRITLVDFGRFRFQTGGSILAGKLALDRGWAINIGGGFHHCSAGKGGGFCAYADITLLVQFLFNYESNRVQNAMIVDLDAHQVRVIGTEIVNYKLCIFLGKRVREGLHA